MAGNDDERRTTVTAKENEGFLGRWSRQKAKARSAEKTDETDKASLTPGHQDDANAIGDEADQPPAFDVSSLPDVDSLGPTSDFSVFMQAGVPAELKTKALRKLWRVKADLANLDGLIDYGEDLTGSFKVVDHLKTAYEVGRGFLRDEPDGKGRDDDADMNEDIIAETAEPSVENPASAAEVGEDRSDAQKAAASAQKAAKQER